MQLPYVIEQHGQTDVQKKDLRVGVKLPSSPPLLQDEEVQSHYSPNIRVQRLTSSEFPHSDEEAGLSVFLSDDVMGESEAALPSFSNSICVLKDSSSANKIDNVLS